MHGMRPLNFNSIFVALVLIFPMEIDAQDRTKIDVSALGPQVGETVPDFSLPDQIGEFRNLQSVMGPNGIILLFHRSADW